MDVLGDLPIESIGAGGLLVALVTLFGYAVNILFRAGDTATQRFEAEIARGEKRENELNEKIEAVSADRDYWFEAYLACKEGRPAPPRSTLPPTSGAPL